MSKKVNKELYVPVRRAVKRGAPPIIKPRRTMATPTAMVKAPARPGRDLRGLIDDKRETELVAGVVDEEGADTQQLSELALAEAATIAADSSPEELAEMAKAARAEREDAATPPETEPAERSDSMGEPYNFLAMYFREMSELDVLRPEEEFRQAKDIETLEIQLWNKIFSLPQMVEHALKVVERTLDNSLIEFRPLRKTVTEVKKADPRPSKAGSEKLAKAAHKVSERLRAIDIDKRLLDAVLLELRKIARNEPERVIVDKLAFTPASSVFKAYYRDIVNQMARTQRAKNEFVKANLRLVVSIARRFNHGRMPLADLIQEGNIGLIKAVERYDYRRGYRFSTYASWWIRHAISRALADKGRAVRLPVHMIDAYHRIAKQKRELTAKLGRQPTTEELGVATGIAPPKIEKMRCYLLDQSFSLDRPVSDEDGRRFIDFIQDPNAEDTSPVEELAEAAMTTEVRDLLRTLKPIEADILRQRFGLDDDKELTLKEIGEKYSLSRERIRQLQEQALLKMRRALQRKDLM